MKFLDIIKSIQSSNGIHIILLNVLLSFIPIILYLISKKSKPKDEYDDLNVNDDHENIAVNLYYKLFNDLISNNFTNISKYCSCIQIISRINMKNIFQPIYVDHKFIAKSTKFFEYLFVSLENQGYTRRVIIKFGKKNQKYVICNLEDE